MDLTRSLGEHHMRSDFLKINKNRFQLLVIGLKGTKKTSPIYNYAPDAVVIKFLQQNSMIDGVKSLF